MANVVDYGKLAFDLIDDFDRLGTAEAVMDRMASVLRVFGYNSFIIATVPEVIGNAQPVFLMNGWPPAWSEHYARESFYRDDPVAAWCRKSVDPFEWSDIKYDAERWPRADHVMHAATEYGLKQGFDVPILRNDGLMSGVVMAGEHPEFDPRAKRAMHIIGLYAHGKAAGLSRDQAPHARKPVLTEGEREVLTWTAAGKSSWEISIILNISEATVVWRIQRAVAKLGAVNRTQAVVNAIRAKEIRI